MKIKTFIIAALAAVFTAVSAVADEPFRLHRYSSFTAGRVTPQSIVFVGNSITNMGCWAETFNDDVRCLNRGNSGAVSSETLENIESTLVGHPAKIFLMIGTNDLGYSWSDDIPFSNVKAILQRIKDESPQTEVYLTSVFPSTVGTRTLENISALNEKYKTLVDDNNKVHYLDLYDDLKDGIVNGIFSLDKLHMGPMGYKIWCDKAASVSGDNTLVSSLIDKDQMSNNVCGLSTSNGMRAQMFCELPSYADDVWIFGDEMVNSGEWQELLGTTKVKNRGWNWGYGGLPITSYTTVMENILSTDSDKMKKEAPKQIFFYVGTSELSSSTAVATVIERYRALINKTKSVAPTTQLFIMSLTPHATAAKNTLTQTYNAQFKALAEETNATYVDIFTPLANSDLTPNLEMLTSNYVYGKGYNKIAQVIGKYIADANPMTDAEFDEQYAVINARNVLGKAVTSAREVIASATGDEQYLTQMQADIDAAITLLQGETVAASQYSALGKELTELVNDALGISLPKTGRYIRVRASDAYVNSSTYASTFGGVPTYMTSVCKQSTSNGVSDYQAVCANSKTGANEATTIFYYEPVVGSEYGYLISYYGGRYAYNGGGNMLGFHQGSWTDNAAVATLVGFQQALAEDGAYHLRYNIAGSAIESARVLACEGNGEVVNGGAATAETLRNYVWSNVMVEYVDELPVEVASGNCIAFAAPVAVTVPSAVEAEFYVVKNADGVLTIHQANAGETYAAGTAFFIKGLTDGTVRFAVKYDADNADTSYVCSSIRTGVAYGAHKDVDGMVSYANIVTVEDGARASSLKYNYLTAGDEVFAYSPTIDVPATVVSKATVPDVEIPVAKGADGGDLIFSFGEAAGLHSVLIERNNGTTTIYDLQGRRVATTRKGEIYVVNGALQKY